MTIDQPSILTIILNYKTPEMTLKSARSAAGAMRGLNGEITIVDNDSQDGSFEAIKAGLEAPDWPEEVAVRVIQSSKNGGFGAGNNVGIRAGLSDGTKPDFVYILNSDAFPAPNAIQCLLNYLQAHPKVGFAGSYIHGDDQHDHITLFRFPSALSELESAARFGPVSKLLKNHIVHLPIPEKSQRVDWLAGASMMMRTSVLDEIGLFDETFFLYFEETDLSLRAARAGHETHYVRESHVEHIGSVSTGMKKWQRIPGYWLESRWHYYTKNHGRAYACAVTLAHMTGGLLWRIRRALQSKPQADPDYFLWDMLVHDLKAMFRPLPGKRAAADCVALEVKAEKY